MEGIVKVVLATERTGVLQADLAARNFIVTGNTSDDVFLKS